MITIDNIDYKPVIKHGIVVPNYYVSKCAKVWNIKTKRYISTYKNYRNNKIVDKKPKCLTFSMTTKGKPWWDKGYKYKVKKGTKDKVEFRMKIHHAVKDAWDPWYDHVNTLTREQLILLLRESMLIDHIDDDISNNHFDNLQYSTPIKNSNWRKQWSK